MSDDSEESFPDWEDPLKSHLSRVKSRKSHHTLKNRKVSMEQFRDYCELQDTTILDANVEHLDDWLDYLNNQDYGGKSILNKFYDISALYKYLHRRTNEDGEPYINKAFVDSLEDIKLDWLNTDPIIDEHIESRYLDIDEYEQLLDGCNTTREELLVRFLWESGARAVEASRTRIDNRPTRNTLHRTQEKFDEQLLQAERLVGEVRSEKNKLWEARNKMAKDVDRLEQRLSIDSATAKEVASLSEELENLTTRVAKIEERQGELVDRLGSVERTITQIKREQEKCQNLSLVDLLRWP